MAVRLHKIIASAGLTSRREAEIWIAQGRVSVNGKTVTTRGTLADPDKDKIKVDGVPLKVNEKIFLTYALYKPKNCLTTMKDPMERETIAKYFPKNKGRLFPVGRLDYDAEGLVIITNDGELANNILHPGKHIWKTYFVKVKGIVDESTLQKLRKGPILEGKKRQFLKAKLIHVVNNKSWLEISLQEGINRQIKKMFAAVGFMVLKIKRYSIGNIELLDLNPGQYRRISEDDLQKLVTSQKEKK